mmetsp:Transcript_83350/g.257674  ORF Transcript_83350/g.257674 Transcript_83350/m.257674 type:complete len:99 (-) Transcript_83350:305-601(-)
MDRVADAVRVTQDNPPAIAVGQAFARILEAIIVSGTNGADAIGGAVEELGHKKRRMLVRGFYGRVADTMQDSLAQRCLSLHDATLGLSGGTFSTSAVS